MTIYTPEGTPFCEAPVTQEAIVKCELMGDYYIELPFELTPARHFPRGTYLLYRGCKFEIMSDVRPEFDNKSGGYKYTLRFEAQQGHMKRRKLFWLKSAHAEATFHDTTFLADFGNLIADNMNRFLGGENWKVAAVPDDLAGMVKLVSFNGDYCWDALNTIAQTFECEWWTVENGAEVWIYFGKLEFGTPERLERGGVVASIPARKGDHSNYGTRFYIFGSTRNIPQDYNPIQQEGFTGHVSETRLHLPDGMPYIDARDNLTQAEIVEQVAFFEDVYPTSTETVTGVGTIPRKVVNSQDDERTFDAYVMHCAQTPFVPGDVIEGATLGCKFTSGVLNGWEFDLALIRDDEKYSVIDPAGWKPEDGYNKKFEIIAQTETYGEEGINTIPNASLCPQPGDTFVLTGVRLPAERIAEAEKKLLEVGRSWARRNSSDTDVYDCPTNPVYCTRNDKNYDIGQKVVLLDGDRFGQKGRISRIQGFEKKLWNEYIATYTVGDNTAYSRLGSIESSLTEAAYAERIGVVSGVGIYLIRSKYDQTLPTDYNAYSAAAADALFMSLRKGGTVNGLVRFRKDITVDSSIVSNDYHAGQFAGAGYKLGRDVWGDSILEVDRAVIRKEAIFTEVVINQLSFTVGETIFSAGGCTCTKVEEKDDAYRCYYDIKEGQHHCGLLVGDQVRCQLYDPARLRVIKYYWRLVTAVGADYVELSKTDFDGDGLPEAGDNLVQFGHRTDVARQSAIVIDPQGGGRAEVFAGIDSYTLSEKNRIGMGVDPTTGRAILYGYGDLYFGDRDRTDAAAAWITFQQKEGDDRSRLYIRGSIEMMEGSSGLGNTEEFRDLSADVGGLGFIRDLFPNGVMYNVATISQLLAVEDGQSNVVAGIYGGGAPELDKNGFADTMHGQLLFFSGAENMNKVVEAGTRIYADGTIITNKLKTTAAQINEASIKSSYLTDVVVSGTLKSPFYVIDESTFTGFEYINHDNFSMKPAASTVFIMLSSDSSQIGRTISLVDYQSTGSGYSITSKCFFENGGKLSMIPLCRECVVLKGYGEGNTFYGWIVLSRTPLPGGKPDILYEGIVEGNKIVKYRSYDNRPLTSWHENTGQYWVNFPTGVKIDPDHYTVMLTGFTKNSTYGHVYACLDWKKNTGFKVLVADDASLNDALFSFQVINTQRWSS